MLIVSVIILTSEKKFKKKISLSETSTQQDTPTVL